MSLTPEQIDMIRRLQPFFREKMGEYREGDEYYNEVTRRTGIASNHWWPDDSFALRVPKPIDWQNPERGLWGMIDHNKFLLSIENSGNLTINVIDNSSTGYQGLCSNLDPFTALLKALREQEGV